MTDSALGVTRETCAGLFRRTASKVLLPQDYHTWNSNEDRAYRAYLTEQHRDYRDFNRTSRSQQQQYFAWRHKHSDDSLFKIVIK